MKLDSTGSGQTGSTGQCYGQSDGGGCGRNAARIDRSGKCFSSNNFRSQESMGKGGGHYAKGCRQLPSGAKTLHQPVFCLVFY